MKIEVGKIFSYWDFEDDIISLYFPGIGIIKAKRAKNGFDYVDLTLEQMMVLKKEIEKELENGKVESQVE